MGFKSEIVVVNRRRPDVSHDTEFLRTTNAGRVAPGICCRAEPLFPFCVAT